VDECGFEIHYIDKRRGIRSCLDYVKTGYSEPYQKCLFDPFPGAWKIHEETRKKDQKLVHERLELNEFVGIVFFVPLWILCYSESWYTISWNFKVYRQEKLGDFASMSQYIISELKPFMGKKKIDWIFNGEGDYDLC
jgi:hypothetical protein